MNDFHNIIKKICEELGIQFNLLSKDWVVMLTKDNITRFISGYKFDLNLHAEGQIFDDKYAMYDVLKALNINVIEHNVVYGVNNKNDYAISCNNMEYLTSLFDKYNKDIVLKINNGTCGINVEHITDLQTLEEKFLKMTTKSNSLSLCPYYDIENEYRAIILNNEIRIFYKKEKPLVIGDGKSTIKELLVSFNAEYFSQIENEDLDVVLEEGKEYLYDWKFNLSRGARMSEEINDFDRENIYKIISEISKKLDLGFCSVDIIKSNNKYYVMEINSGVMMKNFINQAENGYQKAYDIYKEAIINMFSKK